MHRVGIIGAGPAGLATGYSLGKAGINYSIIEAGSALEHRKHDQASELGSGIGGAGLFSDGKFSFYPSGSHLYDIEPQALLKRAYAEIGDLLGSYGIAGADFPTASPRHGNHPKTALSQKLYPSFYASLNHRIELTRRLLANGGEKYVGHIVVAIRKGPNEYIVTCRENHTDRTTELAFTHLVMATGRFGGRELFESAGQFVRFEEQRYEMGIRIEHATGKGFLGKLPGNDVKLIMNQEDAQVRTFCTCRDGEVALIRYPLTSALSGRSDCPPTGYSNFGFLARFWKDSLFQGREVWNDFMARYVPRHRAVWQPLSAFLEKRPVETPSVWSRPWAPRELFEPGAIRAVMHPLLENAIVSGVQQLVIEFPDLLHKDTICLFPAVEGAGIFPRVDASLRQVDTDIWCCGDVVGKFRGLIPALVSGYYVGLAIAEDVGRI